MSRCFTLLPGERAAVGSDYSLYLFDARSGEQLREYVGHSGAVWDVAPSPDNRYLLSASGDMTLRIWDPARSEPLLALFVAGDDWIVWTPAGYYAASPGGERLMGWQVNNGQRKLASFYAAIHFRKSLYRPDLIRRLLTTGSLDEAFSDSAPQPGKASEPSSVAKVLPPVVHITRPDDPSVQVSEPDLEVRAMATPVGRHPVTAMRLLLDGRPYQGRRSIRRVAGNMPARQSWTVQLEPGAHTLAVVAESQVSSATSEPVQVTFVPDRADSVLPTLYLLAIGVSKYAGDLALDYPAIDARELATTVSTAAAAVYQKIQTRVLTDETATRRGILQGLGWLREQMTQRDVGVIFFAGHGVKDLDGTFYLVPVDGVPDDLLSTAIPDSTIKNTVAAIPGRLLLLIDACHAGAGAIEPELKFRALSRSADDFVRDLVTDDYGVVVMAAATGREQSMESKRWQHGAFTKALIEGLAGSADYNRDGLVYLTELDAYVTQRVKVLTSGRQHPVTAKPATIRSFPLTRAAGRDATLK